MALLTASRCNPCRHLQLLFCFLVLCSIAAAFPTQLYTPLDLKWPEAADNDAGQLLLFQAKLTSLYRQVQQCKVVYTPETFAAIRQLFLQTVGLILSLIVMAAMWKAHSARTARADAKSLQRLHLLREQEAQVTAALTKQHIHQMEEARKSLKKARAETRMITRHHTDKIHLPDPAWYQRKFSTLIYAAQHYAFLEADSMVANLLHIMYKLEKLRVLNQYMVEVVQTLPTPSIEPDDDDLILQRDDGPSPSGATEEAMWGKITQLDDNLDVAIQKYLDTIAEPSILNGLESRWNHAAADKYHELMQKTIS